MNWMAATAAFLCSAAVGFQAASKRTRRLRALQTLVLLLQRMLLEMGFAHVPLPDMLFALRAQPPFASSPFLLRCTAAMDEGQRLCDAWNAGVQALQTLLQPWEKTHLLQLGAVLGTTDLDGQTCAMEKTLEVLRQSLLDWQKQSKSGASLCRICGLCAGCVLFIMIL